MFYKNPIFPTFDVCEGPPDASGVSTNCTADTMEQQILRCECKSFFLADDCDHCVDGPFEAPHQWLARGALQTVPLCEEHIPSQTRAVVLTTIAAMLSLLLHRILHYLHSPLLDMLRVEGTYLREAEMELQKQSDSNSTHANDVGKKRLVARRSSRRLRLPTELAASNSRC